MRSHILLVVFVFLRTCLASSQSSHINTEQYTIQNGIHQQPKREFRAFWIVTLDNKDFPSRPGLSVKEQQAEFIDILEKHQKMGMNAVIFQVRPSADAFYNSKYEPWSEWLSGKQGVPPKPFYDPLEFVIEECHRRNMELHAWFNPFRTVYSTEVSDITYNHISKRRANWCLQYGKHSQLNPGLPEVRRYINDIVMDVVKRYDVDGIHFDDYFYPYKIYGKEFPDNQTFRKFSRGFKNKGDWRRDNINQLIKMIHDNIQREKPYVKFGVSPIGVWRNKSEDPRGSATAVGQSSYDYLGADVLKWLEEGWIDYIAPQLYWSIGHARADYVTLTNWWSNNNFNRHLYIGQATYKINHDSDFRWKNPREMSNQLRINRNKPAILGSIFFRSKSLMDNELHFTDTLSQRFYNYPALIPTMPWKDNTPPPSPKELKVTHSKKRIVLRWQIPESSEESNQIKYYVVYRFPKGSKIDLNDPKSILSIQQEAFYYEPKNNTDHYTYAVTSVDRLHNESEPALVDSLGI